MITPGCDGGAHPGYVTCLASTLEECPLETYIFDSGLPFRERSAIWLIAEGTLNPLRGFSSFAPRHSESKLSLCSQFFVGSRPSVITEMSPSGNRDNKCTKTNLTTENLTCANFFDFSELEYFRRSQSYKKNHLSLFVLINFIIFADINPKSSMLRLLDSSKNRITA